MTKYILKNGNEIYLDGYLQNALNTLVFNVKNDWDFVIIISGNRMVRVGKSVLAQNLGAYLADKVGTAFGLNNIFFDSQDMINSAQEMTRNSILIYDEGREGLAATKTQLKVQQDLLDYFAECGQLGHIFIIVLPDFFELKETIAVGRSEVLINVYRKSSNIITDLYGDGNKIPVVRFDRGYFQFFNRHNKEKLYDMAKSTHRKSYALTKADFIGRFTNVYTVNEEEYRKKKFESLAKFKEKKEQEKYNRCEIIRDTIIIDGNLKGLKTSEIIKELEEKYNYTSNPTTVNRIIYQYKQECLENMPNPNL